MIKLNLGKNKTNFIGPCKAKRLNEWHMLEQRHGKKNIIVKKVTVARCTFNNFTIDYFIIYFVLFNKNLEFVLIEMC